MKKENDANDCHAHDQADNRNGENRNGHERVQDVEPGGHNIIPPLTQFIGSPLGLHIGPKSHIHIFSLC